MELVLFMLLALVVLAFAFALWRMRDRYEILREFFEFLRERKLLWIAPVILVFVLAGIFVAVAASSGVGAFLYVLH